nr:hypothetical protein [Tanacetum cinerariifolium]
MCNPPFDQTAMIKERRRIQKASCAINSSTQLGKKNSLIQAEALACLAGVDKRAEALRCRADALGQRADEYLGKADAFGQQAKADLKHHVNEDEEEENVDGVEVPSNKRKRDQEEQIELELDPDDNDDDFEQVEEMTLPLVISRIDNGKIVHEIEILLKPLVLDHPRFKQKLLICLPCGHIFGASCIKRWLQIDICSKKCPQCNFVCSFESARPLYATSFRIPVADIGAEDQKTPTRRFLLNKLGMIEFLKLEIARRNLALKKWYDAKKRLAEDGSLCEADALGTLANEYLRRAKAYEGRAKALRQRAKAYNQQVDAMDPRVDYFADRCDNIAKLG